MGFKTKTIPHAFLDDGYVSAGKKMVCGKPITSWVSTKAEDRIWDDFLLTTPIGEFEQSSLWARAKQHDNWGPIRVLFTQEELILGGFQILVKPTHFYRSLGYISKGPVIPSNNPDLIQFVIDKLRTICKEYKIVALIIQPPDRASNLAMDLMCEGFLPNYIMNITHSTAVIDLKKDWSDIFRSMRETTRRYIRRAKRCKITLREGDENDLGSFYHLMLSTCIRQGVQPNPSSEEFVTKMWKVFNPGEHIKLLMVEYGGEKLAALLMIPFGQYVKVWKVGWSGEHNDLRPNYLLYSEAIKWAKEHGYEYFDLYGLNAEAASAIIRQDPLPEMFKSTPAFFKLGFGGQPLLFPDAQVFIYNRLLKFAYSKLFPRRWFSRISHGIASRLLSR